jgi:hypothetical protein
MKPQRIQRKRTKGWRMPQGAIYVGRPTRWGNPFAMGEMNSYAEDEDHPYGRPSTAEEVVALYRMGITFVPPYAFEPLRGHDLVCWCPLDQPCHADVLLEVANR